MSVTGDIPKTILMICQANSLDPDQLTQWRIAGPDVFLAFGEQVVRIEVSAIPAQWLPLPEHAEATPPTGGVGGKKKRGASS